MGNYRLESRQNPVGPLLYRIDVDLGATGGSRELELDEPDVSIADFTDPSSSNLALVEDSVVKIAKTPVTVVISEIRQQLEEQSRMNRDAYLDCTRPMDYDALEMYFAEVYGHVLLSDQEEMKSSEKIEKGLVAKEIKEGRGGDIFQRDLEEEFFQSLDPEQRALFDDLNTSGTQWQIPRNIFLESLSIPQKKLFKKVERKKIASSIALQKTLHQNDIPDYLDQVIAEGKEAENVLVNANQRLVISIAKHYIGLGLDFIDLIQEGNVGLLKAIHRHDFRRGNRFSTYAYFWIRQKISRALREHHGMSIGFYDDILAFQALIPIVIQATEKVTPTTADFAAYLVYSHPDLVSDLNWDQLRQFANWYDSRPKQNSTCLPEVARLMHELTNTRLQFAKDPLFLREWNIAYASVLNYQAAIHFLDQPSLDEPVNGTTETLADTIVDSTGQAPDEYVESAHLRKIISEVLQGSDKIIGDDGYAQSIPWLSQTEIDVLTMRFGLRDGNDHTMDKIAKRLGLPVDRIKQTEQKALRKLRYPGRTNLLEDYLPITRISSDTTTDQSDT